MPSYFEEIDGVKLHYEKVGNGPQVLLLIPGAIGEWWLSDQPIIFVNANI